MKKDIDFIKLNSSLIKWLYEKLENNDDKKEGINELIEAVNELKNGKISAFDARA